MATSIRLMTAADISLGMRLKEQAGWNQLEADWRRFLDLGPQGCFVAELDDEPVGTAVTCVFGGVAWVAMMLVDEGHRRRGLGTALVEHALAYLDSLPVRTVRLDATPLGRPVYEKLGFRPDYELARYAGTLPRRPCSNSLPRLSLGQMGRLVEFDKAITGADRTSMLSALLLEWPRSVRLLTDGERFHGYLAARPGAKALQIGPCVATPEAGPVLLADACQRFAGRNVYLDVPVGNTEAVQVAEAAGLTVQRHLLRMTRGEPSGERADHLWASSGPEKG